jgi:hypothetical protein
MEKSISDLYEASDQTHEDFVIVRIKDGPYVGVEYTYGKISVSESEDKTAAKFIFDPIIVKNPNDVKLDDVFFKLVGDVLVNLLENWIEETKDEFEDRTDNITDIDDERKLLSQGDPIFKE